MKVQPVKKLSKVHYKMKCMPWVICQMKIKNLSLGKDKDAYWSENYIQLHKICWLYCIYFHSDIYIQKLLSLSDFWVGVRLYLLASIVWLFCVTLDILYCLQECHGAKVHGNEALRNNVHKGFLVSYQPIFTLKRAVHKWHLWLLYIQTSPLKDFLPEDYGLNWVKNLFG